MARLGRAVAAVGLVVAASVGLMCGAGSAHAETTYPTAKACIDAIGSQPGYSALNIDEYSCVSRSGGRWAIARHDSSPDAQGAGFFGVVLVIALLWSALPAVIAGTIASSRAQGVAAAVVLAIFLGWIGVAIVYFGQRKEVLEPARRAFDNLAEPTAPSPSTGSASARLRTLDDLRTQGLISDDEYGQRRKVILEST